MHLRSGNGYSGRRVVEGPVCSSAAVSNNNNKSKKRKSEPEPGIFSKMLPVYQRALYSTCIFVLDLLYYLLLFALLTIFSASIIRAFVQDRQHNGNYYDILGVTPLAPRRDIRAAYRKLSLGYHPDKMAGDTAEDDTAYLRIREAYEALNVEDHVRCMYDLTHGIEGRWSAEDCISARKEYSIQEKVRRQEEFEKAREKMEAEKEERRQRREERWRQQAEEEERAKFASRARAALKGFAPW